MRQSIDDVNDRSSKDKAAAAERDEADECDEDWPEQRPRRDDQELLYLLHRPLRRRLLQRLRRDEYQPRRRLEQRPVRSFTEGCEEAPGGDGTLQRCVDGGDIQRLGLYLR